MQQPEQQIYYGPAHLKNLSAIDTNRIPQVPADEAEPFRPNSMCELCPGKNCKGCSISPDGINFIGNIFNLDEVPVEHRLEVSIALTKGGFKDKVTTWNDPDDTSIPPHIKRKPVANFAFYKPEIDATFSGQIDKRGEIALVVLQGNQLETIVQTAPKLIPENPKMSTMPNPIATTEEPSINTRVHTQDTPTHFVGGIVQQPELHPSVQERPQDLPLQEQVQSHHLQQEQSRPVFTSEARRKETNVSLHSTIQPNPQVERNLPLQVSREQTREKTRIQSTELLFIPREQVTNWITPQENDWELTVPDQYQPPKKISRKRYSRETPVRPIISRETPTDEPLTSTPFEKMIQTHTEAKYMLFEFLTELTPQPSIDSSTSTETQQVPKESNQFKPTLEITTSKPLQLIKQFLTASGAQEKTISGYFTPDTKQEVVIIDYILPISEQTLDAQSISTPEQTIALQSTSTPEQTIVLQPEPNSEQMIIKIMNKKDGETTIILSETAAKTIINRLKTYVSSQVISEDIEIAPQEDHSRIANIVSPYSDTFIGFILISTVLYINQLLAMNTIFEELPINSTTI